MLCIKKKKNDLHIYSVRCYESKAISESEEMKSKRIGIIEHIECVPRVIRPRKGRIADWLVLPLSSGDS